MRTVLIVDDERNIRLGLQAMIEHEYVNRYRIVLAAHGEEALHVMTSQQVDIVITDIRMPVMDGLTFIRDIRQNGAGTSVIIVSGYDDFQYAKTAIQYGVKEYLLKPIVRKDLFQLLDRLDVEIAQHEEIANRLQQLNQYEADLRSSEIHYILMNTDMSEQEMNDRCRKMGLSVMESQFYIGVLKFSDDNGGLPNFSDVLSRMNTDYEVVRMNDKDGHHVFMTNEDLFFPDLMKYLDEKCCANYVLGVSDKGSGFVEIKSYYEQAKHVVKYSFLQAQPETALITYDSIRHRSRSYQLPLDDIRRLANMVGTDRDQEMRLLWYQLIDVKRWNQNDIAYIEDINKYVNEYVLDQTFLNYGEESIDILKLYKRVSNIYNFQTVHEYARCTENLLVGLSQYIKSIKSVHTEHKEMKRAVQYIHDNFRKQNLNMAMVSNYVSLNYSYFSQAFKEYTSESFVTYLKKIRIKEAKILLQDTNEKIYEIGTKVGFDQVKQFNRVFRELEGISAVEYRDKMLVRKVGGA